MEFCDLKSQYNAYKAEIDAAIQGVIQNTAFINGPEVRALESELCAFNGAQYALGCANGTDSIQIALMALGVGQGDEVIVPDFTFYATAEMPALVGATPVFADIDPVSFNITAETIEPLITSKTKGIIPVSLFGQLPDMDAINALAAKHGLWVMEDGAQSFGANFQGRRSGSLSLLATTSFFPAKPLGCYGDGGAIFTSSEELAAKMKQILNHGSSKRYHHSVIGLNSRLDSLHAAILRVKLRYFEQELAHRDQAARWYTERLDGVVGTPVILPGHFSAWAQYTIRAERRNDLQSFLQSKGIPSTVHYPMPMHAQEVFAHYSIADEQRPHAALAAKQVLSLPMHGLISESDVDHVCQTIREFYA